MPNIQPGTEPLKAFLFHCTAAWETHAISLDLTGRNLPPSACLTGWVFEREVMIGSREPLPLPVARDAVLHGLTSAGYYVWHDSRHPTTAAG